MSTVEAHHEQPKQFRPGPCIYCTSMMTRVTHTWTHKGGTNSKPFKIRRIKCHKCGRAYKQ